MWKQGIQQQKVESILKQQKKKKRAKKSIKKSRKQLKPIDVEKKPRTKTTTTVIYIYIYTLKPLIVSEVVLPTVSTFHLLHLDHPNSHRLATEFLRLCNTKSILFVDDKDATPPFFFFFSSLIKKEKKKKEKIV
jgi:hypothetical protein